MSRQEYDQALITPRVRDFQAGGKIVVTILLCPKETPKQMFNALNCRRRNAELDLRNIKTILGMEHLGCKSPQMAIRELGVYLLAYHLVRLLVEQPALVPEQIRRQLSFKHTVQIWIAWQQRGGGVHDAVAINALLVLIAESRVGLSPGGLTWRPQA